ncbi:hypothetical protein IMSHALPRED_003330 [Imshaugia aleurites]|uniref:Karyogamy protein n=1 Tax=Imshaugia aleurites TaxID=172621 RepID=A0A8H3F6F6_9LECA|nr:hypothetical protein IMSHALPRED_003330 [Imshaugia aleurites]
MMTGYNILTGFSNKGRNGSITKIELSAQKSKDTLPVGSPKDDEPLSTSGATSTQQRLASPVDAESYFNSRNSMRSSRANSVYSLSRISLASQLSQLTSLALPNATSLSSSISSIPTAPIAVTTLSNAADQIRRWLQKATEVLSGLDAEDDVEWAAAGGREGLEEVQAAIKKFESLIGVYVKAIEDLQERDDISDVPKAQLTAVVDQMETILEGWETVRRSLKGIKRQVELAMEWEELWNVVLGDIGLEVENLSRLVFEMEEARHKALQADSSESIGALDMQELDTIVEEGERETTSHRISLSNVLSPGSPVESPGTGMAPEDDRLLALFARMQPLRASLDFLPMTLSNFHAKAQSILPTACQELESRRISLEKKWKTLERDAQRLRQELGEDRWVLLFRNAGRQAQKLCESIERAISKLQEAIDVGAQHSNPPLLAKKVEAYEAKKIHYGPAIEKVLGIIDKGVNDRFTVNGEILRLQSDTKARWQSTSSDMKDIDLALEDLTINKNQQLRDSISSIMSMDRSLDRSGNGSAVDTPGSSPASSIVMGPSNGKKRDESPGMNGFSRRGSIVFSSSARLNNIRRNFTMPPGSPGSLQLPHKTPMSRSSRSFTSDGWSSSRDASPSPYNKQASATPTPGCRSQQSSVDNKPRWNSSPKVDYFEFGQKPRPVPYSTLSLGRKSSMAARSLSSAGSHLNSPGLALPSPLGRSSPASALVTGTMLQRPRIASGAQSSIGIRQTSSSSPANSTDWVKVKDKTPPATASKKESIRLGSTSDSPPDIPPGDSPSARPRLQRPMTSFANSRRVSMLPLPKHSPLATSNGRETALGLRTVSNGNGRDTSFGSGPTRNGRDSSMGPRPMSKGKDSGLSSRGR